MTDDMPTATSLYDKDAARALYAELVALNPHLPPEHLVPRGDDIELRFGADQLAVLRLSVYVALPPSEKSPDGAETDTKDSTG